MKKRICILLPAVLALCLLPGARLAAEGYQYQYFADTEKRFVPFSDYIPRVRNHYLTVPHYLEDFYQMYGRPQYYNENDLRLNIARMQTALKANFRHPSQALCKIQSDEEYYKYRNLMFMHINLLIMRDYLKIATRYDKQVVRFYDYSWQKEITESLDIASGLYREALPYWAEAKRYAERASKVRLTTDLGTIESERYSIITGELDYERIIKNYLARVERNKAELNRLAAKYEGR